MIRIDLHGRHLFVPLLNHLVDELGRLSLVLAVSWRSADISGLLSHGRLRYVPILVGSCHELLLLLLLHLLLLLLVHHFPKLLNNRSDFKFSLFY